MIENIVISNPEELERLKNKISEEGSEKIHVLADFDRTLTNAFVDGEEVPSLISVLRDGSYLTKDYAEKAHALFNKYHPIEIDPGINLKDKKKLMLRWWTKHFELLIKSGLNKKDLENVVKSGKVKFRAGALDFLDILHEKNIPLIIMSSSGLGIESISMFLENKGRFYDNIHIISNSFKWDKKGNAVGIKKPIIHCMNKDETMVKDFPVFDIIKDRKNVLLLGDNIEDIGMVEGFEYENLIKIGFLNKNVKENLENYKKNYDVVILNDANMNFVNRILKDIIITGK